MEFSGYNRSYLDEYIRRSQTDLGRRIVKARWDLVKQFTLGGTLLDYGCANGAFHRSAPAGYTAYGWDVNPNSPFSGDEPTGHRRILTLWDVMEHLQEPYRPLQRFSPTVVFICTPNADNAPSDAYEGWKHFKPVEHIHYWTPHTLTMGMAANGYTRTHLDYDEGRLRDAENPEAIFTAVFVKCHSIH
jgi:hypothetical protein